MFFKRRSARCAARRRSSPVADSARRRQPRQRRRRSAPRYRDRCQTPATGAAAPDRGRQRGRLLAALPLRHHHPRRPAGLGDAARVPVDAPRGPEGDRSQILAGASDLLAPGDCSPAETRCGFGDWDFTPSATRSTVSGATDLTLQRGAGRGRRRADLPVPRPTTTWSDVTGAGDRPRAQRRHPAGWHGSAVFAIPKSDSVEHARELGVVVKADKASADPIREAEAQRADRLSTGPFEWVAVKSKYFVTALLAFDTDRRRAQRAASAARARSAPTRARTPTEPAVISAGLPLPAAGQFHYQVYAGPMEYPRLRAIGHDFYDVNPYGWPGFRTIIRPVALGARSLLVWMHDRSGSPTAWG